MKKPQVIEVHQEGPTLASKVEHAPDGVDEAALAQTDAHVAAGLVHAFLAGAEADIAAIEQHYRTAAGLPYDERGVALRELFALVHGLRGQGGSFGFPMITAIAASLNRFIEARALFDAAAMTAISGHVTALRTVLEARMAGDGGPAGQEILDGLARLSTRE